jgi:hypothetical protein
MDAEGIALALPLTDPASVGSAETQKALAAANNDVLLRAQNALYMLGDSAEAVVRVVRALSPEKTSVIPRYSDASWQRHRLGNALIVRGHLADGSRLNDRVTGEGAVAAILGAYAPDSVWKLWEKTLKDGGDCTPCFFNYWASRGDTASIVRAGREGDSALKTMRGIPPGFTHYASQLTHAFLTLARADSAAALQEFEALPDTLCYGCGMIEIVQGQLLEAAHRDREALVIVSVSGSAMDYYAMMLTLERGRIAERLGEKEIAVDSYARVANRWQNGDPFLQPYVKEARAALARLGGEHAKGIPIAGAPASQ